MSITFKDKYYKYNGVAENKEIYVEDIGLSIGGYEPAVLPNILASYIFKMTAELFTNTIICGIYRDNGL
eukprot:10322511-Ditylum_brightwellii.AAC.1